MQKFWFQLLRVRFGCVPSGLHWCTSGGSTVVLAQDHAQRSAGPGQDLLNASTVRLHKYKRSSYSRWAICQGINLALSTPHCHHCSSAARAPFSLPSVSQSQPSQLSHAKQGVLPLMSHRRLNLSVRWGLRQLSHKNILRYVQVRTLIIINKLFLTRKWYKRLPK